MSKKWLSVGLIVVGVIITGVAIVLLYRQQDLLLNPAANIPASESPQLDASAYAFEVLQTRTPQASKIIIKDIINDEAAYRSYVVTYESEGNDISGQLNVPKQATPSAGFPTVIMLRGFVDPQHYTTGTGTRNAAAVYATNGYVTLAPDFLGYGQSDAPDLNPIIARLGRPVDVIDLLASLSSLDFIDDNNLFLWGHSNGGQIALSVLEITGKDIPTTLWAPVSKPFPYSILYYTDEFDDQGKALRQVVAEFEANHDSFHYSIDKYWDWIKAPIQIHQGGVDDAVPLNWSTELADTLKALGLDITYYQYPAADHNLSPDWNTVVQRDLAFFNSHLDED